MSSRIAAISRLSPQAPADCCRLSLPPCSAVLLGVIGFAPIEVVHNAANDTRHAVAFPCH
jgi:Probable cobalt transporter subunit (CbtB)